MIIELLKQALEALEMNSTLNPHICRLIGAIDKELAKPEPEPIEYRIEWFDKRVGVVENKMDLTTDDIESGRWKQIPLYTSPQQQKPLSDDEILKIINDIDEIEDLNYWEKEAIKRGIKLGEKARGIGWYE